LSRVRADLHADVQAHFDQVRQTMRRRNRPPEIGIFVRMALKRFWRIEAAEIRVPSAA